MVVWWCHQCVHSAVQQRWCWGGRGGDAVTVRMTNEALTAYGWLAEILALNKRFGFLSGVNRKIAEVKVEGDRAVFRLQAITSNSFEAQQLCAKLRVAGENCLIVR